jgi:hypothetical protein
LAIFNFDWTKTNVEHDNDRCPVGMIVIVSNRSDSILPK